MALELADFATMKKTMDACIRRGILTDWFLFADNCLRIAPPLTITSEEIETACNELLAALSE